MKTVKIISAILLVIILFVAEAFAMGIFAVDKAISKDSVSEAMVESDIVSQLVEEALIEETVNMGGEYGEMIDAVFHTAAMRDFLSDYLTALINTELYGQKYEEIANDELMQAFSDGIDEVNEAGSYNISPMEGELLKQAIQQEIPDLTAEMNAQAMEETVGPQFLVSPFIKIILVAVCLLLCAGIAALCWKSKLGVLWCSLVTALVSLIYFILYCLVGGAAAVSASDKMMYLMVQKGFHYVCLTGCAVAAAFFVAFIVLRVIYRNKNKPTQNGNIFYTENTHM